jgi:hypothetical protein
MYCTVGHTLFNLLISMINNEIDCRCNCHITITVTSTESNSIEKFSYQKHSSLPCSTFFYCATLCITLNISYRTGIENSIFNIQKFHEKMKVKIVNCAMNTV